MPNQQTFNIMSYKTDYLMAKLMNSLRELSKIEYSHENYGECVKRSIQWLRVYVVMLPKYKEFISDNYKYNQFIPKMQDELEKCYDKEATHFMTIIDALSIDNYDAVINKYMDCSKFLVGPTVYQLVQKVNSYLANAQQWEVFMTYNEMVEADNGLHLSDTRNKKLFECIRRIHNIRNCPKEQLTTYQSVIDKLRFRVKVDECDNVLVTDGFEHMQNPETDKSNEYDIVNTANIYEVPEWTEITTPQWANVLPKEWDATDLSGEISGKRLTPQNAKVGQYVSYQTKKGTEYGKILDIQPNYVEVERLMKKSDGSFTTHTKPMCKVSGNKPAFTRVITIL